MRGEAGIVDAPHHSLKGLCHGFGINATVKEEQDIAAEMWT